MYLGRVKTIHFIGIGGIGMSGIAELMINQGFEVTGSDLAENDAIQRLRNLGARITINHAPENIGNADMIIFSSAVTEENSEIQEARRRNLMVIRRAEMLAELMRMKYSIAVAGTHGKTTTTSMIGKVMTEGNMDPTIIVGGILKSLNTNAQLGLGEFLVAEADEFDRSFLRLVPTIAVITTLEAEHLDCYKNLDEIKSAFIEFANKVPFFGSVIVCLDEPEVQSILPQIERRVITYGLNPQADVRAEDVVLGENKISASIFIENRPMGHIAMHTTGEQYLKNALAAVAVGTELNVSFPVIQNALAGFSGVRRRFEIKGKIDNILIVDDYAHHPTEIRVTLIGAKKSWKRRIISVFQPHLFSRTRDFSEQFGRAFLHSDILIVTDIYPAREKPIPGVTGKIIADNARLSGHKNVYYVPKWEDIVPQIKRVARPGDMIITMGAGDIWKIGELLLTQQVL